MKDWQIGVWITAGCVLAVFNIVALLILVDMAIHPTPNGGFFVLHVGMRKMLIFTMLLDSVLAGATVVGAVLLDVNKIYIRERDRRYPNGIIAGPLYDSNAALLENARLRRLLKACAL